MNAPKSIEWRGLTLDRTLRVTGHQFPPKGRWCYGLCITSELEVSVHSEAPAEDGKREWEATVGLGRCDQPRVMPEEALDQALRAHLTELEVFTERARQLEALGDFLKLVEVECTNCGRTVTCGDDKEPPAKCYACPVPKAEPGRNWYDEATG